MKLKENSSYNRFRLVQRTVMVCFILATSACNYQPIIDALSQTPTPESTITPPEGVKLYGEGDTIPNGSWVLTRYYNPEHNNGTVLWYIAQTGNDWSYTPENENNLYSQHWFGFNNPSQITGFACDMITQDIQSGYPVEQRFSCPNYEPDQT